MDSFCPKGFVRYDPPKILQNLSDKATLLFKLSVPQKAKEFWPATIMLLHFLANWAAIGLRQAFYNPLPTFDNEELKRQKR